MRKTPGYKELEAVVLKNKTISDIHRAICGEVKIKYQRSKILFIGEGEAGKTSTIRSLAKEKFEEKHHSTSVAEATQQLLLSNLCAGKWSKLDQNDAHLLGNDFQFD